MTAWLPLVPINFLISGVLTFSLNWLMAIPWRKSSAAHWTQRARLLWPVRASSKLNILLIPVGISLAEMTIWRELWPYYGLALITALLGAILGTFPLDREIFPRLTFRIWLRLVIITWTIKVGTVGALVAAVVLMPDEPGVATGVIGVGVLLYILALNFGLYILALRKMGALRFPNDRLRAIVADTSKRVGAREPRAWLLDLPLALAFAFPTTGDLMFSSRLLEISSDEEISTVCAHELAHLMESKSVQAGRLVGSLTFYPLIFLRPAGHFGPSMVGAIIVLVLLSLGLTKKLSRRMEKNADKFASESQVEEGQYARALEKIYCDNLIPAVVPGKLKVHPHLYDRMMAAGIQPDYPRPAKPAGMAWSTFIIFLALGVLIGLQLAK